MRLMLTGANGQVGWELRRSLLPIGDVIALDRTGCDLSRPRDLPRIIGELKPDIVVNAAAYTAVDRAEEEERLATVVNGTAVGVPADPLQLTGSRDAFFDTVSFKGAFGPAGVARDWAAGWTAAGTLQ